MICSSRGLHVDRAVDQRLPGRLDELGDLLQRRLAEDRRRVADEVDPELPRDLGLRGRRAEPHQALLEPLGLEVAGERLLHDEHDPVAAAPQHVADAHAVVGRAVRPLGEEHDRPAVGHAGTSFVARSVVGKAAPMIARRPCRSRGADDWSRARDRFASRTERSGERSARRAGDSDTWLARRFTRRRTCRVTRWASETASPACVSRGGAPPPAPAKPRSGPRDRATSSAPRGSATAAPTRTPARPSPAPGGPRGGSPAPAAPPAAAGASSTGGRGSAEPGAASSTWSASRGTAWYAASAPYPKRSGTRPCCTSESTSRVESVVCANTTPTAAMAMTRAASPTPAASAAHVTWNGPSTNATGRDGSALAPENSALNRPIPIAASHSGATPVNRRTHGIPPRPRPASTTTIVTNAGRQEARREREAREPDEGDQELDQRARATEDARPAGPRWARAAR